MSQARPTISTHVLDIGAGRPAAGIRVTCWRLAGDAAHPAGSGVTDGDGRIADLLGGEELAAGRYRLAFDLGPGRFHEAITLDIRVEDASRGHHVPLLAAPFGLTTYRGS